ncbi:hypothetical protein [Pseudomonas sp. R37(2017)]|uniref:hypothetical protein n=1 Tax=Pseudomonas sp. R37(2017) TaxID=1981685 RepID=UPI000A1FFA44|nr:hypothetical protein [Pseudomonas sp. R37(2017)]
MKKTLRPEFSRQPIPMAVCNECRGSATMNGLYGPRPCMKRSVSGWVSIDTGEALPLEDLVFQVSLKLQQVQQQIEALKSVPTVSGRAAQYQHNNRRGAGGTNFTGD